MSLTLNPTKCCGMREIDNLGHPTTAQEAMKAFCLTLPQEWDYTSSIPKLGKRRVDFALVTFTGVVDRHRLDHSSDRPDNYGEAFASLIETMNLGNVATSRAARNPRTGNVIQCWIWQVNTERLQEYASRIDAEVEAERKKQEDDARRSHGGAPGTGGTIGEVERAPESFWQSQRLGPPAAPAGRGISYADILRATSAADRDPRLVVERARAAHEQTRWLRDEILRRLNNDAYRYYRGRGNDDWGPNAGDNLDAPAPAQTQQPPADAPSEE